MAVLIEGISVLVRVSAIASKFAGGIGAFGNLVRNATYCADDDLARVGFMTPSDTGSFIEQLVRRGLTHLSHDAAADIVVVDQLQGPLSACSWVEFGHVFLDGEKKQRIAICRITGSADGKVAMPIGWRFEGSLSNSHRFVPTGKVDESLKFLRNENGVDVYVDLKTGKQAYVGRVAASDDDVKHDALYKRATALLGFATRMVAPVRLSLMQKWRVRRGLGLLRKVLSIRPTSWTALWMMGKALQALGKHAEALDAFSRSYSINPRHPDVAREASISAMECSKYDEAQSFAEKAMQLRPEDPGLLANLALVMLLRQDPHAAKEQVERAYAADPQDRITRTIRQLVDEVIAGTRTCPRHTQELHG
jgi:tetratricopeptide repeat protein